MRAISGSLHRVGGRGLHYCNRENGGGRCPARVGQPWQEEGSVESSTKLK